MKKIITVLGARPQFIKAAVLSRVVRFYDDIEEVIVHTGQHFDTNMSKIFFEEMMIPKPKYYLGINKMSHGVMTGKMMGEIEKILSIEKPDALVVYGDTNSTIAGALAAKKMHIKLVHIEAGLRSFNMKMPEEINRILTDRIADLLICPTQKAVHNLNQEGFENFPVTIRNHGDIMKDAVTYYGQFSDKKSTIIRDLKLKTNQFVLATIHRQENIDDYEKLTNIFNALEHIHKTQTVILPLHPRTKKVLKRYSIEPKVSIIEPVGYYSMLKLLKNCSVVITDSGGLQKEAFFNSKPVVIMRDETEWIELVDHGFAKVVGNNTKLIIDTFQFYKDSSMDFSIELYGNNVVEKIYQSIYQLIH